MARDYDAGYRHDLAGYDRDYRGARRGYGRELVGYGADYEPFPGDGDRWHTGGAGFRRRLLLSRLDSRTRGTAGGVSAGGWRQGAAAGAPWRGQPPGRVFRGYERREPYAPAERRTRDISPDHRRYLSEDEYGLGPRRAYDREFEDERFRRGPLGPRNALFGGEGFVRYDRDYDEQWW